MNARLLPGLLAALLAAGCSGSPSPSASTSAPSSAPATSAAAPGEAAPSASPSDAGTPGAGVEVVDPCTVLDAAQVSKLTGVAVQKGQASAVTGSKLCTWLPKDATSSDAALFTAQVGPAQGGSLSDAEAPLRKQFGGTVTKTTVAGAEDARYISGKASNANVIDVLALKGDAFYQVLAAGPRSVTSHKDGVYKLAEALVRG